MADEIHQIGRILAIVDSEAGRKPDRLRIFAKKPRADGVECAGPGQDVGQGACRTAAAPAHKVGEDAVDPPRHLRRGAPREGQEHDAARIGAMFDEIGDAMRQRRGLAGPGAGDDQQRSGVAKRPAAMPDGAELLRIELFQARRRHGTNFFGSNHRGPSQDWITILVLFAMGPYPVLDAGQISGPGPQDIPLVVGRLSPMP